MSLQILAPVAGRLVPLSGVPDPVFAGLMLGPGIGIDPVRAASTAVAPVSGTVRRLNPHAFVVTAEGRSVLVHLGIDTVQLKGEGFMVHVSEGAEVTAGDAIVSWDPVAVEASGKPPVVPVVALEGSPDQLDGLAVGGDVAAGDVIFTWS
jgi:PTS system N-acetylglucosamine-specific IIA component